MSPTGLTEERKGFAFMERFFFFKQNGSHLTKKRHNREGFLISVCICSVAWKDQGTTFQDKS